MNSINKPISKHSPVKAHILGLPRIGAQRELKWALEDYWSKKITQSQLIEQANELKHKNWTAQIDAGLDFITVGDFAWYDHVLNISSYLGVVPKRFNHKSGAPVDLDTYFRIARGRSVKGEDAPASDMTKWFDTNYHYIVPEFSLDQQFNVNGASLIEDIKNAQTLLVSETHNNKVKPVLIGPLTYLWLGKLEKNNELDTNDIDHEDKLSLLPDLLNAYSHLLHEISLQGIEWVQIDEPILSLDLPISWRAAFERAYNQITKGPLKILLASYFGPLNENLALACNLPVAGIHLDGVAGKKDLVNVLDKLPAYKVLSLGLVNGRNIWRNDLSKSLATLESFYHELGDRLWVASSCSLLHSPVDLDSELNLDPELKSVLSFSVQKISEVSILASALNGEDVAAQLSAADTAILQRSQSASVHNDEVKLKVDCINEALFNRYSPYAQRSLAQKSAFKLPLYPTTTIGSFPQTKDIRTARRLYKKGELSKILYDTTMEISIQQAITEQEKIGLDVLVHGEAERNDMVEYFGEQLNGYAFTEFGWVQSYGSRCVKPPIISGDISREKPMTINWIQYAQSLTTKPVKGMLTGPITMLCWSFAREDISLKQQAYQIGLALREEVADLENAGISIIQVDEPALREGLPLRRADWADYLKWAVDAFKLSVAVVQDTTQIHTHMCYSEFNDIIASIADLDADVITIETSRSNMELLNAFEKFNYPNEIGPGVYDIHSPIVPNQQWMQSLIEKAAERIPADRLWVNPDCGLKTRAWPETREALTLMVKAAATLRADAKVVTF
ncbi:MAG: 5-methyltetrahydropteroyltriglutamate--homocysteine methyltransferase [Psychrobacter glaciei]|jgi:5-methyltetrahydropteroyltriglutamate--homocysteine methyltransferase